LKIGLALGSGGARGLAHIAVIEKLHAMNIDVNVTTGSSIGSVVGALYCLYGLDGLMERMMELVRLNQDIVKKADEIMGKKHHLKDGVVEVSKIVFAHSLLAGDVIYDSLKALFDSKKFSDCKRKFATVAFDIDRGKSVTIDEGFILDAVVASSSVPGTFPPVRLGGMRLVDGGTTRVIPVKEAKELGADFVIGVDVSPFSADVSNMLSIQYTVDDVKGRLLADIDLDEADMAIQFDIPHIQWYDFLKSERIYQLAKRELENFDFSPLLKRQNVELSS
jgi:NTE family protein